jgi:hypothetical protein
MNHVQAATKAGTMNRLNELATVSSEQRRIELTKLLAIAVIRIVQRQRAAQTESDNSGETLTDGLDES